MENSGKKKTKALVMALSMAVVGLLPTVAVAQGGGLFGRGDDAYNQGLPNRGTASGYGMLDRGGSGNYSLSNQQFGSGTNGGYELTNQTFGETPLGSGLLVMLAAGAGYATIKSKKKKNNKSNLKK